MKNKHLFFLLSGLMLCSISLGFAKKEPTLKVANAATKKLTYDEDNKISLGSFPDSYNDSESKVLQAKGVIAYLEESTPVDNPNFGLIKHNNNIYGLLTAFVDKERSGTLSDGTSASSVDGKDVIFDIKPIKWVKYSEGEGYVDFISDKVLFRDIFNDVSVDKLLYKDSALKQVLNNGFLQAAFTTSDLNYLSDISFQTETMKVVLPEEDVLSKSEPKAVAPSDYAICKTLSSHEGYNHAPYWTADVGHNSTTRRIVKWYGSSTTECLVNDNKIGVRPVIRIKSSLLGASKSSSSTSKSGGGGNAALILGIITGVLGAGALVAFFIFWNKKLKATPGFKAPGWYYAIIFVAAGFCAISVITLSVDSTGGGGIGGSRLKPGYYLQSTPREQQGNIIQVGMSCYLFRADGTVGYCAACETSDASDFVADSGHGSWTQSGSTVNLKYTTPMGSVNANFKLSGEKLYYGSTEAYHWVRGE